MLFGRRDRRICRAGCQAADCLYRLYAAIPSHDKITQAGIEYLQDNSKMQKVGELLKAMMDEIAQLAALVL